MNLSVVIITYNEEKNLARCLKSLPLGVEIIVLDSGSTDLTKAIALEFGASWHERAFDDFAHQKNHALQLASRDYVLSLDADEQVSEGLAKELMQVCASQDSLTGYRLVRRLEFMGKPLRYGRTVDRPLRLVKRGQGRFEGGIHEKLVVSGPIGVLREGCLWHRSYQDLSDYFARFNRYTSLVAESHLRSQKKVFLLFHVLRPFWEFLSRYVLRLGFLDGYPGYVYALNSSLYSFTKYSKVLEARMNRGG